jgi:hypothetical protein
MPHPTDALRAGRISAETLARAVHEVTALDHNGQLALCDEIAADQPNLLAAILAATRMRPGAVEADLLVKILMISFRAMRLSGHRWALIREADQERQLTRLTASVRFAADLPGGLQNLAEQSFIAEHPEPMLLAYVLHELKTWMHRPEVRRVELEQDKFVMFAALNTVQCIANGQPLDPP